MHSVTLERVYGHILAITGCAHGLDSSTLTHGGVKTKKHPTPTPRVHGTELCPLSLSHLSTQLGGDNRSLHPTCSYPWQLKAPSLSPPPRFPRSFPPLLSPADAPRSLGLALPESRRGPEAEAGARKEGGAKRGGWGRVFTSPAPECARGGGGGRASLGETGIA